MTATPEPLDSRMLSYVKSPKLYRKVMPARAVTSSKRGPAASRHPPPAAKAPARIASFTNERERILQRYSTRPGAAILRTAYDTQSQKEAFQMKSILRTTLVALAVALLAPAALADEAKAGAPKAKSAAKPAALVT